MVKTPSEAETLGAEPRAWTAGKPLTGLVAVVTGGESGIGLATTLALQTAGAQVVSLDIAPQNSNRDIMYLQTDVTRGEQVDSAIQATIAGYGQVDILVNNAGIGSIGSIADTPQEEWFRVFDVNVLGIVRMTRAALPYLRRSEHASIINISSVVATVGLPQRACYSATKGAVLSLTLATAADLLPDRIRVNCLCPGTVDTPWVARLLKETLDPEEQRAALEARQPMGRLGTPEEIAAAIVFLASPSASFITGTALTIDGGLQGLRLP